MRNYNRYGLIPQSWWEGAGDFASELSDWLAPFSEFRRNAYTPPRMTFEEKADDFEVRVMLPGCRGDAIAAEVVGDFLTIKAEQPATELAENERFIHSERTSGRFEETIKLPGRVDPAGVTAKYKDGILTITLPREAPRQPAAIKVAVAD